MSETLAVGDILPDWLDELRKEAARARRRDVAVRAGIGRPIERRNGRPTRLHDRLIEVVCHHVAEGQTQDVAARLAHVPKSTFNAWVKRGRDALAKWEATGTIPEGEGVFVTLVVELEEARSEAEAAVVGVIQRAARGEVVSEVEEHLDAYGEEVVRRTIRFRPPSESAAKWWLERSFPDRYGNRLAVSGPEGGPIGVEVEVSARDLLKKKLGLVAERLDVEPEAS